jgi:hypothetical protein
MQDLEKRKGHFHMKNHATMRVLSAIEYDQVSGGLSLHTAPTPIGGPVSPEPPTPPIIIERGPNKPSGGPVPSPQNPGPFPVG